MLNLATPPILFRTNGIIGRDRHAAAAHYDRHRAVTREGGCVGLGGCMPLPRAAGSGGREGASIINERGTGGL